MTSLEPSTTSPYLRHITTPPGPWVPKKTRKNTRTQQRMSCTTMHQTSMKTLLTHKDP